MSNSCGCLWPVSHQESLSQCRSLCPAGSPLFSASSCWFFVVFSFILLVLHCLQLHPAGSPLSLASSCWFFIVFSFILVVPQGGGSGPSALNSACVLELYKSALLLPHCLPGPVLTFSSCNLSPGLCGGKESQPVHAQPCE